MAKRRIKTAERRCGCGCGDTPKGDKSRFCIGHDARFHGRVKKLGDGRLTMTDLKKQLGRRGTYAVPGYTKAVKSH